jgi:hypothetical protein
MNRIEFTLPDVGLREIRGMVYLEDGYLVLKVEDALMGEFDVDEHIIKVEPQALKYVRMRTGLLRDRLVIKPKRAKLLDLVPGKHTSTLELRVRRRDRENLEDLVEAFRALT